jgi:hypothetical protein
LTILPSMRTVSMFAGVAERTRVDSRSPMDVMLMSSARISRMSAREVADRGLGSPHRLPVCLVEGQRAAVYIRAWPGRSRHVYHVATSDRRHGHRQPDRYQGIAACSHLRLWSA